MAKRPNPADSTLRNLRAQRTRDATIAAELAKLKARVTALERAVGALAFASKRRVR